MNLAREAGFRLGAMQVRPSTREIVFAGGRDVLEPRVMAVLVELARANGEVVTREDLTAACWDGRVVSDDAINRVISRIRKVSELTQQKDFTLETITKVGYRLVAVQQAGAPSLVPDVAQPATPPVKPRGRSPWLVIAAVALAVFVSAAGIRWFLVREPEWNPDPKASLTLAVLPFDNMGSSGDQALAVGMSREIRNTLSRVRGLRVVSDSSSFAVASEAISATDMGKRLNADLLLDGSLSREGETVRISAELVDGWSGVNLWTESRSAPFADLDSLRQMMAAAVFEQLVARIGPNRVEMLTAPKRSDPTVYRLLVDAREELESTVTSRMRGRAGDTLDAGDRANALIDQALAIEPDSALGLRLKAQIVAMGATHELFEKGTPVPVKQAEAAVYLRRALASDPDNASALGALGEYYRRFEWRWDDAQALLQRALALDPNDVEAHLSYSYYLSGAGRCKEALEHARAAVEIDPEFGWRTLGVPRALKCLGRYEESDAGYLASMRHDPANLFVLREMYINYLVRRDADGMDRLRAHVRDDLWKGAPNEDVQRWLDWTGVASAVLRGGDRKPFAELIEKDVRADLPYGDRTGVREINRGKGDVMWIQAVEFAIAGEPERSIDLLESSISVGTLYIPETMPYGEFEFSAEVRASPRYQALWRKDPRLIELSKMRLQSLRDRQMKGVLPDGTVVNPEAEGAASKAPIDSRS